MGEKTFHIAMYPWLAFGHITPFLHLANKLAERGHRISFLMPEKTVPKFESFNHHRNLINFHPITVPHVEGLPPSTETSADVPFDLVSLVIVAMDLTEPAIESLLSHLKPDFIFFDFSYWLPSIARNLGMKSVNYCIVSPATIGYYKREAGKICTVDDWMNPPVGFSGSSIRLRLHEAKEVVSEIVSAANKHDKSRISFGLRHAIAYSECDAIAFKSCREMEGPFCKFVEKIFNRPVFFAGPVVPETPISVLNEKISKTLDSFEPGSAVYCAFGSECILKQDQFEELLLGLELTGLPFLAALKPPIEVESLDSALPNGFKERTQGKGLITSDWVQQQLILEHPSIGCFVTHCGSGSLFEAMVNTCQLVLLPHRGDQNINARFMGGDLNVGVEVEKSEEEGLFTRHSVCKAVKAVMDEDSEIGKQVRLNHRKWREFLLSDGLENSYIDEFVRKLHALKG